MKAVPRFAGWLCGAWHVPVRAIRTLHLSHGRPSRASWSRLPNLRCQARGLQARSCRPVELRKQPIMTAEGYSVWGLGYSLRSRPHRGTVTREPITVVGYIVATNLASAPACAMHKVGIADPEDCTAPVPAFWLGDRPDAAIADSVKVMGFASNYAQIYDAIQEFDRASQRSMAFGVRRSRTHCRQRGPE